MTDVRWRWRKMAEALASVIDDRTYNPINKKMTTAPERDGEEECMRT